MVLSLPNYIQFQVGIRKGGCGGLKFLFRSKNLFTSVLINSDFVALAINGEPVTYEQLGPTQVNLRKYTVFKVSENLTDKSYKILWDPQRDVRT